MVLHALAIIATVLLGDLAHGVRALPRIGPSAKRIASLNPGAAGFRMLEEAIPRQARGRTA